MSSIPIPPDNLIGHTFGSYTVLSIDPDAPQKLIIKCECGNVKSISLSLLKSGWIPSCRHCTVEKKKEALIGRSFGKTTVIQYLHSSHFLCRCDCGNEFETSYRNLQDGTITACPVCSRPSQSDSDFLIKIGDTFGQLTVTSQEINPNGGTLWHCRCSCGSPVRADSYDLLHGYITSCRKCIPAHSKYEKKPIHLGDQFGNLTVIEYAGNPGTHTLLKCLCTCGRERLVKACYLYSGMIRACNECTIKISIHSPHAG